jgi:hypothetical protein
MGIRIKTQAPSSGVLITRQAWLGLIRFSSTKATMLSGRFLYRTYSARFHFAAYPHFRLPAQNAQKRRILGPVRVRSPLVWANLWSCLRRLGPSIHQHCLNTPSGSRREPKNFSRELPDAIWHGDNLSGSFHSPSLVPRSGSVRMTGY